MKVIALWTDVHSGPMILPPVMIDGGIAIAISGCVCIVVVATNTTTATTTQTAILITVIHSTGIQSGAFMFLIGIEFGSVYSFNVFPQ